MPNRLPYTDLHPWDPALNKVNGTKVNLTRTLGSLCRHRTSTPMEGCQKILGHKETWKLNVAPITEMHLLPSISVQ